MSLFKYNVNVKDYKTSLLKFIFRYYAKQLKEMHDVVKMFYRNTKHMSTNIIKSTLKLMDIGTKGLF